MHFSAEVRTAGKTATGVEVPDDVVSGLGGGKRPKVTATINGFSYRTSIGSMHGVFMLPISAEVRAAAGVAGGDRIEVALALDTEERRVEVPDDLAIALADTPGVRDRFDRLSYSQQRQHVLAVDGAKGADTRRRRILKVVDALSDRV